MSWTPAPGMKVVCVDDSNTNCWNIVEIVAGRIYTVRAVVDPDELANTFFGRPLDEPGVLLVEVNRPKEPELGEMPFAAARFRPLDGETVGIVAGEAVPA
jgi:hypothetical protein